MTANCTDLPNRLQLHGDVTLGLRFGEIQTMTPVILPGEGHRPVIKVRLKGGLSLDFSPATAAELARRLVDALRFMPDPPNVSGALVDLEEV